MIARDHNRANVIIWSIANETPHSADRDKFLGNLAKYARTLWHVGRQHRHLYPAGHRQLALDGRLLGSRRLQFVDIAVRYTTPAMTAIMVSTTIIMRSVSRLEMDFILMNCSE